MNETPIALDIERAGDVAGGALRTWVRGDGIFACPDRGCGLRPGQRYARASAEGAHLPALHTDVWSIPASHQRTDATVCGGAPAGHRGGWLLAGILGGSITGCARDADPRCPARRSARG